MSSSSSSSKESSVLNREQPFDRPRVILTPIMTFDSHLPSSTTHIVLPKRVHRSQVTPDSSDYSNNAGQISDYQQYGQNHPQRRFSAYQINDSSIPNVYLSENGRYSPTVSMGQNYQKQYRLPANHGRALISVSSTQSPLITIASTGSPSRSEIRVSSLPTKNLSTLREIRISRPDSPSISINRTGGGQPITFTSNANGGTITNGTGGAFHISVEAPSKITQHDRHPQASPTFHQLDMHHDSVDNRYTSNIVANRFQSHMAYTSSNNNNNNNNNNIASDRSSTNANLPPTSSSTLLPIRTVNSIRKEQSDVDHLTKSLIKSTCARCNDEVIEEADGLIAMDRRYHVSCFTCTMCGCRLRGMHFYSMENKPYCESCYINSLEKCAICARPITDRILRATGKPYHAQCFCCVTCQKTLDGVPFTIDATMQIQCINCFHEKFAPRCCICHRPILPAAGQEETIRVVAFDRSYHMDCYRCESCNVQLTSEEGCYPIDDHILCLPCNRQYSTALLGHS